MAERKPYTTQTTRQRRETTLQPTGPGRWDMDPTFLLYWNGKPLTALRRQCVQFIHRRRVNKPAEAIITFRNDGRDILGLPEMLPNAFWLYRFGYAGYLSEVRGGYIRQISPTYAEKRVVTVQLIDGLGDLRTSSQSKNWGSQSSSDVVRALAKKNGWRADVDNSNDAFFGFVQPGDQNDFMYILHMAAQIDFEVSLEGTPGRQQTLRYKKKDYSKKPVGRMAYQDAVGPYANVKYFSPNIKSLGVVSAGATGTDAQKGRAATGLSDQASKALALFALDNSIRVVGSIANTLATLVPSKVNTQAVAKVWKDQMLDRSMEAHSEHRLHPGIKISDLWDWSGLDAQLNGLWYVVEEEHTINGSSASTRVVWKRNAIAKGTAKDNKKNKNVNTQKSLAILPQNGGPTVVREVPLEGGYSAAPLVVRNSSGD